MAAASSILDISKWLLISNILSEFSRRFPVLVIGRGGGSDVVAYYTVGNEIARLPTTELEGPLRQAMYPGLSLIASEPNRLRKAFLDIFGISVLLFLPLLVGIFLLSKLVVLILLGERWLPVEPFLQILAFAGVVDLLRGYSRSILLLSNAPHRVAQIAVMRFAAVVPSVFIGVYTGGPIGAAWGVLFSGTVATVISLAHFRE